MRCAVSISASYFYIRDGENFGVHPSSFDLDFRDHLAGPGGVEDPCFLADFSIGQMLPYVKTWGL
jgi:hypothetical protein